MNLTRTTFDAACDSLAGTPHAMNPDQCTALWYALFPSVAKRRAGRMCWTPVATALRNPLLREINTVQVQATRRQFKGQVLTKGTKTVDIGQLHTAYASQLNALRMRIDNAMRDHGHWCTPEAADQAQPLRIVVANERAANRIAGNTDWTQWENPAVVRKTQDIFADYTATLPPIRGAQWQPYMPRGVRKRGAAGLLKQMREWRGAFHDAVHAPLYDPDSSVPLQAFHAQLSAPHIQQAIEESIRVQCDLHRRPKNPAFKFSIWHALHLSVRNTLANEFHEALRITYADMRENGQRMAELYNPVTVFNPWALTQEERKLAGLN